jgi:hypothetical protein
MAHTDTAFDHHDRTEFQLERLILFTDAVFAIITGCAISTPFLFLLTIPFSRLYQRRYRRLQAQHAARQAATEVQ